MEILHSAAQFERAQHVAVNIDISIEIRIADQAFVDASDRAQTPAIFYCHTKAWRVNAETLNGLVGQNDIERNRRS
jgi:hypothetical protein